MTAPTSAGTVPERLLGHPVSRLLVTTAALNSAADWVLFATMVVTVDAFVGGAWATALVIAGRLLPAIVFAPIAARRVDRRPLRTLLVGHEALRFGAVVALALAARAGSVVAAVAAVATLEFAAAMQAAAREATTSRHVPPAVFTPLNTATAVLSYGLLPVGAALVAAVGPDAGWILAAGAYALLTLRYARAELAGASAAQHAEAAGAGAAAGAEARRKGGAILRISVAAALGLIPAVMLFTLAPLLAETWVGAAERTGLLYGLVISGGAVGFVLANRARPRAGQGMALAAAGAGLAAGGLWLVGLPVLGVGAGAAYLDLQNRLQHAARDPSEFARAFAVLKVATGAAVVAAPTLVDAVGVGRTLAVGAATAVAGALVAEGSRIVQVAVRELLGLVLRLVVRLEVVGAERRLVGPAVIVSNHPHWLDGAIAILTDRSLRPVARWQRHRGARLAIWAGGAVVTTAGTDRAHRPAYEAAAEHLRTGGRIWLAPEGGSHQEPVLRAPRSGAVRMAHAAGVAIQPLGIEHRPPARWRPWRRRRITVTWGAPVSTTGDVHADADRMMAALAAVTGMAWTPLPELAVDPRLALLA